jgi:hypothetical protein
MLKSSVSTKHLVSTRFSSSLGSWKFFKPRYILFETFFVIFTPKGSSLLILVG